MRFIHIADCHLGGWRQPELRDLNFACFKKVIDIAIGEKVEFVLIAGDLFDSAYPSIETIRDAFQEFRRLNDAGISVFMIAGSHDFSASGKSFLDVLEKAGFAKNVFKPEERNGSIILHPTLYKNIAIYGYPGKKSGLEVDEIARMKIDDAPGLYKILMLHTAIRDAVKTLPIPAVDEKLLPKVNYTAMGHLHVTYNKDNRVYAGPIFPNNSSELEELKGGSFYIVDTAGKIERRELRLKEVLVISLEIKNALTATDDILNELKNYSLGDKIIILKLFGTLDKGKTSDIKFNEIEDYVKKQRAYVLLKSTTKLYSHEGEITFETSSDNIEEDIITTFERENPHEFNSMVRPLIAVLQAEKKEEEKVAIFEERLFSEVNRIIEI